jgi:hypothetical protein
MILGRFLGDSQQQGKVLCLGENSKTTEQKKTNRVRLSLLLSFLLSEKSNHIRVSRLVA